MTISTKRHKDRPFKAICDETNNKKYIVILKM